MSKVVVVIATVEVLVGAFDVVTIVQAPGSVP